MGYRDDVDALYMREPIRQRRQWRETPRPLRDLPAAETTLSQLIDTFVQPAMPPKPKPAKPSAQRARLLEATRDRLLALDLECLVLVGAIVESRS